MTAAAVAVAVVAATGNSKRINMGLFVSMLRGINQPTIESISSLSIEDAYTYEQCENG